MTSKRITLAASCRHTEWKWGSFHSNSPGSLCQTSRLSPAPRRNTACRCQGAQMWAQSQTPQTHAAANSSVPGTAWWKLKGDCWEPQRQCNTDDISPVALTWHEREGLPGQVCLFFGKKNYPTVKKRKYCQRRLRITCKCKITILKLVKPTNRQIPAAHAHCDQSGSRFQNKCPMF